MKYNDNLILMQLCKDCKLYTTDKCNGQYCIKGCEVVSCSSYIFKSTSGVIPKDCQAIFPKEVSKNG